MPGDLYYDDVVLLAHCDGADESTTFTDNSPNPKTITRGGTARIDTAQSKWGGASCRKDAGSNYLYVTAAAAGGAFDMGTGSWTAEAWFWLENAGSDISGLFMLGNAASGTGRRTLQLDSAATAPANVIWYQGNTFYITSGSPFPGAQWVHCAACFDASDNTLRIFINGTAVITEVLASPTWPTSCYCVVGATSNTGSNGFRGWIDDIRVTKGVARYTANFTPPTEAFADSGINPAWVSAASPLGLPAVRAFAPIRGRIDVPSMLDAPAAVALEDFSAYLDPAYRVIRYGMDLVTPSGLVRVPISSWQATSSAVDQSYAQCVVPACAPYVDAIGDATNFSIIRSFRLLDGRTIEAALAGGPVGFVQFAQGAYNQTATISGYSEPVVGPASVSRELRGARVMFTDTGIRIRAAIDWLLRPGNTATLGATELTVTYINYIATGRAGSGDEYMDVGERA